MSGIELKPSAACRWDLISLGEVLLRLDPGEGRVGTARSFRVWEGGGEYNVARGLRRCFGLRTAVATALADNPIGRLVEDLILQGGVDTSLIRWVPYDGVGRAARNGLNFTERGFGARAGVTTYDRGHTACSQLRPGDIDWDVIFGQQGARWFHTGGIFAALSDDTAKVAREAMEVAHRHGVVVSYDLNYRASMWKALGGPPAAQAANRALVPLVDVLFGNEEDLTAALGFEVESVNAALTKLDPRSFARTMAAAVRAYPNIRVAATTLRAVTSASRNDWGAVCYSDGATYEATRWPDLEILDRVGGGDSFASGFIYGLLADLGLQRAVDLGAAHGALAMSTPGDTSMATLAEVERVAAGGGARVVR